MKHTILSLTLFFFSAVSLLSAQVDFQMKTLAEVSSNKPIFIDVYTTWCGPCKKMDKTSFQDSTVSAILNKNFTCLKWDAEDDKYREKCEEFAVNSYPSLLFLNKDQELININIGFSNPKALVKTTKEVLQYLDNTQMVPEEPLKLSLDESLDLLSQLSWLEDSKKSSLVEHIIGLMKDNDSLWKANSDLLSISAHNDMDLGNIKKLISYNEQPNFYGTRSIETAIRVKSRLSVILDYRMSKAMIADDYPLYLYVSQLKSELVLSSSQKKVPGFSEKQLKTDRLNFYRFHGQSAHYKPLADSLLDAYLLPHSPAKVLAADQELIKTSRRFEEAAGVFSDQVADSTSVEFYTDNHQTGMKFADRLDDIAHGILEIYDDKSSLEKALEYSELSYKYMELPQYLITKARTLYKLGEKAQAIQVLELVKVHQFYNSEKHSVDSLLAEYGRE